MNNVLCVTKNELNEKQENKKQHLLRNLKKSRAKQPCSILCLAIPDNEVQCISIHWNAISNTAVKTMPRNAILYSLRKHSRTSQ